MERVDVKILITCMIVLVLAGLVSAMPIYVQPLDGDVGVGNNYKTLRHYEFRIFPGDPTGLPDDFFSDDFINLLSLGGILLK